MTAINGSLCKHLPKRKGRKDESEKKCTSPFIVELPSESTTATGKVIVGGQHDNDGFQKLGKLKPL